MNPSKERAAKTVMGRAGAASPKIPGNLHLEWKNLGAVADVISKVLVPIMLGIVGLALNSALKEKDVGVQMVELAVGILRVDPGNADTPQATELRDWAIRVIDHYSEVPLQEAASELRASPLLTAVSSSDLVTETVFRTVGVGGRLVQGLEVLCAPSSRLDDAQVVGSDSRASATLTRGRYECWSRDPRNRKEGSHVIVDLINQGESTVNIPAPE